MQKFLQALLATLLIISVSFAEIKIENPILNAAATGDIDYLLSISDKAELNEKDQYGFTLYDYARMNNHQEILYFAKQNNIRSGVDKALIQRVQFWFFLLNIPTDNMRGIYNDKMQQNIINYQITRGLASNPSLAPNWFADLETEGVLFIQNTLMPYYPGEIELTGVWDEATRITFANLQQRYNLPPKEYLTYKNIGVLKLLDENNKKIDANTLAQNLKNAHQTTLQSPKQKIIQETLEESKKADEEHSGFLIASNAKPGKLLTLQVWLTLAGFPAGELDGAMGPLTRQAIRDYQESINQKPTGIMDRAWEAVLEASIRKRVQQKLKRIDLYQQEVDGINGLATTDAIKQYEKSKNIKETGKMLPEMLASLFNEGLLAGDESPEDTELMSRTVVDTTDEENLIDEELIDEQLASNEEEETPSNEAPPEIVQTEQTKAEEETLALPQKFSPTGDNKVILNQLMLAYLDFYQEDINGKESESLKAAIEKFQQQNKVGVDGAFGPQTNKLLEEKTITKLQEYFRKKALMEDDPTGTLGPKTRKIIADLKKDAQLPSNHELDIGLLLIAFDAEKNTDYLKKYLTLIEQDRLERERITTAQEYLIALKFLSGKASGALDEPTKKAISSFRKTYRLQPGNHINQALIPFFEEALLKRTQGELNKMGYALSVDGKIGDKTTKAIRDIEQKNKLTVTGKPSTQLLAFLDRRNTARVAAQTQRDNRRAPAQITQTERTERTTPQVNITARSQQRTAVSTVVNSAPRALPNLQNRAVQADGILRAEPQNTIKGRLSLIRNSKGVLSGCKVNNITLAADWCDEGKANQQCRVLYKNGRVLSVRCR